MSGSKTRLLMVCVALACKSVAIGQTWDGGGVAGGVATWSTGTNWNPDGVPVNNGTANIVMAGTIDLSNVVDVNFDINSLTFANTAGANPWTINNTGGAILTIRGGGVTNSDTDSQLLNTLITLGASQTWSATGGAITHASGQSLSLGTNLLTLAGAGAMTLSSPITGSGGLVVNSAGLVVLSSGANSYGGGTTLNSGTLLLNSGSVLGAGALTLNGGTLQAQIVPVSVANPTTIGGNFAVGGALGVTASGAMTLTGSRSVNITNTATTTFSGAISETTLSVFSKNGSGTLVFAGTAANTFTGGTIINDGTLTLSKTAGVNAITVIAGVGDGIGAPNSARLTQTTSNQIADSSSVAIGSDGQWDLGSNLETVSAVSLRGGSSLINNGTLTFNLVLDLQPGGAGTAEIQGDNGLLNLASGTRSINVDDTAGSSVDLRIRNRITNGSLIKDGLGTLEIAGAQSNLHTGTTTVNNGTLILNKSPNVAAIGGPLVLNTGTATTVVVAAAGQIPIGNTVTLNGGTTLRIDAGQILGPITFSSGGTIDIGSLGSLSLFTTVTSQASSNQAVIGNLAIDRQISLGGSQKTFDVAEGPVPVDLLLTGTVSSGSIVKAGAGTMQITGVSTNNSFSGLTVNTGTVQLNKPAGIDAVTGSVVVGDGAGGGMADVLRLLQANQLSQTVSDTLTVNNSGLFDLNGFAESVGTLQLNSGVVNGGTLAPTNTINVSAQSIGSLITSNIDCLGTPLTITVDEGAATDDLFVTGTLFNGSVIKSGTGLIRISGFDANTAGLAGINAGTIVLDKPAGVVAFAGTLSNIGENIGAPQTDVLRWGSSDNQLPSTISLTVNGSGWVDLNNRSDTINSLTLVGTGVVTTGTGTLTVLGDLNSSAFGSGSGSVAGNLNLAGTLNANIGDAPVAIDVNVSAVLTNGALVKTGLGTLQLSAGALSSVVSYDLQAGTLAANGVLTVDAAQSFTQSGGTFTGTLVNNGDFVFNGGTFGGQLNNNANAVFNASFLAGNGMTNASSIVVGNGKVLTLNGTGLLNDLSGSISLAGGTIGGTGALANNGAISGAGTIAGTGGFTNSITGVVTLGGAVSLTNSGANTNSGVIAIGSNTFSVANNLLNNGLITLGGGVMTGAGAVTNAAGGEIRGGSSVLAALTNNGGLIRAVSGSVLNLSSLSGGNINGGELRMDDNATLNVVSTFPSSGTIVLNGTNSMMNGGAITHTGTMRGQGRVNNVVVNGGTVRAEGGTLTLAALGNTNSVTGRIEAGSGAQVLFSRGLGTNSGQIALTGGSFDNNNNVMSNPGFIEGYGTLRTGGLSNTGSISVGGNLDVLGSVTNNGTVSTQTGSTARFFGPVNGAGSYSGTGTTMFLNTFSPGNSPAIVNFTGNMILTGTATLEIEIGGFLPGSEHDQVNVAQIVALGGRLDVRSWNGFQLLPGDQFTVLTFGTRSGDFSNMTFTGNTFPGLGVTRLFTANSMIVKATGLPGDANLDGSVNFDDLLVLAQNYNASGQTWFTGDFNRTGTVTFDDLLVLAQNFGTSLLDDRQAEDLGSEFASDFLLARSLTPEPSLVLSLGAAAIFVQRCRILR